MITTTDPGPAEARWTLATTNGQYLTWGNDLDTEGIANEVTPAIAGITVDTSRVTVDGRPGVIAGRDTLRGFTIDFHLVFHAPTRHEVLDATEAVGALFAEGMALPAGTMWTLTRTYAGFTASTHGRPTLWEADLSKMHAGLTRATATFEALVPWWVTAPTPGDGSTAQPVTITATPTDSVTGLVLPVTLPWSTLTEDDFATTISTPTKAWPRFTIDGPLTNPTIRVGTHQLRLTAALGDHETLTVQTLPGARAITTSTGRNLAGSIDPTGARLDDLAFTPGQNTVLVQGIAPTTDTSVAITWVTPNV